jgi:hypothetical protein
MQKWMFVLIAVCLADLLGLAQEPVAATRLGLFHTQEEVWCWRQRAGIDPQGTHGITCPVRYVHAGDVSTNSPGNWDHIVANRNTFAANPSNGRWTAPPTIDGCVQPINDINDPANRWPEPPDISGTNYSFRLRDAAFYALVTGNQTDWPAIKQEILWTTSQSFTQFGNPNGIWCFGYLGDKQIAYYGTSALMRLIFAYEYVGRTNFTASERDQVERWMFDAADFHRRDSDEFFNAQYVDRWAGDYTPTSACSTDPAQPAWVGGPLMRFWYGQIYNNRGGSILHFTFLTGLALQQAGRTYTDGRYGTLAQIVESGRMYFKEYIRYAVYPEGVVSEFARRLDTSPDLGWAYAGVAIGEMAEVADAYARAGDPSLYQYTTSDGLCGSEGTINDGGSRQGQNKDFLFAIQEHMKYITDGYARYWPDTSTENNRIDGRHPRDGSVWHGVHESHLVLSNVYYQDSFVRQAYTRTHPNSIPYPSIPQGVPPFQGSYGYFPGMLFMYGNLEGLVGLGQPIDPYTSTAATDPTCTITAPTTAAMYDTATSPLATLAGTAADFNGTVSSITWACPECTPTSGTFTCTNCGTGSATWTLVGASPASIGLTDNSDNVLTITATDNDSDTGTCQLTVHYDSTPDLSGLLAYWTFDEASGNATDVTGHGHTGVVSGGVTRTQDQTGGNAIVFDGSTGGMTASGLFGSPPSITMAVWVKLDTPPQEGWGEIINIGDYTGLHVSGTNVTGFWWANGIYNTVTATPTMGTTWHHVAVTITAGAQRLYVDGVEVNAHAVAQGIAWAAPGQYQSTTTLVGKHPVQAWWLDGALDDLRVYDRVLSGTDIAVLASSLGTGRVGWYKLDDSGTTATDSATNPQNGTLLPGGGEGTWTTGQVDGALTFNGTTQYVSIPATAKLDFTGDFSLAAWVTRSAPTAGNDCLLARTDGNSTDYEFCLMDSDGADTGKLRLYVDVPATTTLFSTSGVTDTLPHHVAVTRLGSTVTFYVDGQPVGTGTLSGALQDANVTTLLGSNSNPASLLGGTLDEVLLYNRALTQSEITALASLNTAPSCTITTPASSPTAVGSQPYTALEGAATDDTLVETVTWVNSATMSGGNATDGGGGWATFAVSSIPLVPGQNLITVTATDTEGLQGTCQTRLDYTPPSTGLLGPPYSLTFLP